MLTEGQLTQYETFGFVVLRVFSADELAIIGDEFDAGLARAEEEAVLPEMVRQEAGLVDMFPLLRPHLDWKLSADQFERVVAFFDPTMPSGTNLFSVHGTRYRILPDVLRHYSFAGSRPVSRGGPFQHRRRHP